jgi:RNA polymerase sigma factor (sigma-70 family)
VEEHEWLAQRFEEHRTHLRAVAYRMLGSVSEADDAVQEAWLRLSRADTSGVENMGGWLTTVVARVCLNMLRSRQARREQPLDVHVPEPIVSREDGVDPEHEALLADSVGLALLVVLDTLAPAERLAFVLHDSSSSTSRLVEVSSAPVGSSANSTSGRVTSSARTRIAARSRPAATRARVDPDSSRAG